MSIFQLIKYSLKVLWSNRTRTFLTVLGVVIGISSVIIVFSAGEGIKSLVVGQIETFGTNIIEVEIKTPTAKKGAKAEQQNASAMVEGAQITTLTLDDMEDIVKLPNIRDCYSGIMSQEQVNFGIETAKAFIFGTNASFIDIDKSEIDSGRFFSDAEDKSLSQVIVLGSKMKDKLFGSSDAIGKSVKIRKSKYRVIGIMKERGAVMQMDFDDYIYIPIRTLQKRIMGINHVLYMVSELNDVALAEQTAEDARVILRENHNIAPPLDGLDIGKDDFRVVTMKEMMDTMDTITGVITLLLLAIVAISLLVGGVGIMNIMYVIVNERTMEIGLRKALGAKYADIMKQFLVESVMITVLGGIIGSLIGILISFLISYGANLFGLDWKFQIPFKSFVVAFCFSTFFGVIFGLYPARQAARLSPIEALRKE